MRRFPLLSVLLLLTLALIPAPAQAAADTVEDLGTPLTSLTIMTGAVGREADGSDVVYAVPAGENAHLNIVDLHSRQLKRSIPLPGASGSWAVTVSSDGRVYVGSYANARLYRYDPATTQVTDLGSPIPGEQYVYGLSAGENGVIFGGTYPNTHAFKFDPATGQTTDYGTIPGTEKYTRATAYDPVQKVLFAGVLSPKARLIRIDTTTGEKREITPAGLTGSGFSDMSYVDGKIFAQVDNQLYVIDAVTGELVSFKDPSGATVQKYPIIARGVSPASNGAVYFTATAYAVTRYDLATNTLSTVMSGGQPVSLGRGAAIGYGWITENGSPKLYGLAGNYAAGTFSFDPATSALDVWTSPFEYVPAPLENVLADPTTGKVYVNAFLNGSTVVYDPATGTSAATTKLGQTEGWAWGPNGKIYAGTYPNGQLSEWDPVTGTNRVLFALEATHHQNRPVAVLPFGGKLFVGTTPGYGLYGGALTVYDLATGALDVHRDIVTDQTIASLLPLDGKIWAGSSTDAGQGADPRATEARLFLFDPATQQKTAEYTPVPGARSINELTIGPDGKIWGLADGTVFVFDPATRKVVRKITVFSAPASAQDGALLWRDGYLYGTSAGRLFVVDSLAGTAKLLRTSGLLRLDATPDGRMYMLLRVPGETEMSHLGRFTPPADKCPNSDLRPTVWRHGVDSRVRNRFVRDGCTLADLIRG